MGVPREARRTFALAVIRSVLDGVLTREEIERIPHGCDDSKEEFRRRVYAIAGLILKEPEGLIDKNLFLQGSVSAVLQAAIGDEYPMYNAKDILQFVGLIEHYRIGPPGVPVVKAPRNDMLGISTLTTVNPVPRLIVPLDLLGLGDRFDDRPLPLPDPSVTVLVGKIARKGDDAIAQAIAELRAAQREKRRQ